MFQPYYYSCYVYIKNLQHTMITKLICLSIKHYLPVEAAEEVVVETEVGVVVVRRVAINEPSAT